MPNYRPRITIGKDTRRSSYMLEYAIAAGATASGADAYMLHVTTTPSVSYVTRTDEFDCGIMITASHNPFYDNGIKLINRYGEKMDDATTALVEAYRTATYSVWGWTETSFRWHAVRQSAASWTMWQGATATSATRSRWHRIPTAR